LTHVKPDLFYKLNMVVTYACPKERGRARITDALFLLRPSA
jgi:hypothetical protein